MPSRQSTALRDRKKDEKEEKENSANLSSQQQLQRTSTTGQRRSRRNLKGTGTYEALSQNDDAVPNEESQFDTMVEKGMCSQEMMDWAQNWLSSAEAGELDIYTCMGLSNGNTLTPDTRRLVLKVLGVTVLQLVIPCILLKVQLAAGFSYRPMVGSFSFRFMGSSLYLYSLWSMYNNALDECRSTLLQWAIDQRVSCGHWWPLLAGEFLNVFVSLILVVTLFVIFTDVEAPAELILNAVAVNFLGGVDAEFVDEAAKNEAVTNFRRVFEQYASEEQETHGHNRVIGWLLFITLTFVVIAGVFLSCVFFFAPTADADVEGGIGHKSMGPTRLI